MLRDDENMVVRYAGKVSHLLGFIDMCEKTDRMRSITIHSDDYNKLKKDFTGLYNVVQAAGGVVVNENNEVLFIHRRGFWDLPKGKREIGEKKKTTAIREVMEETGIEGIEIIEKLTKTYHTYKTKKGSRKIKLTHWYRMTGKYQPLVPQSEESIDKAVWMTLDDFYSNTRKVYANILNVLNTLNIDS